VFASNEIQDERRRTRPRVALTGKVEVISNVNAQRSDVRSIAWLDAGGMKRFSPIIASATEEFGFEMCFRLTGPFAARRANPLVAVCAPRVWPRVIRISRPEEADASSLGQALYDVLTHERLLLESVLRAINAGSAFGHTTMRSI
jgi:hypothetical protein